MHTTLVRKAIENILYKSAVDKEFRKKCLQDGKAILEKELNIELDKDIKVHFKENDNKLKDIKLNGKDLLFILPDYVGSINKLNRDDLEKITGGVSQYRDINDQSINLLVKEIY